MDAPLVLLVGSAVVIAILFVGGYFVARRTIRADAESRLSAELPPRRVVLMGVLTFGLTVGMLFGSAAPETAFGSWLRDVGFGMYFLMLACGYIVLSGIVEALARANWLRRG